MDNPRPDAPAAPRPDPVLVTAQPYNLVGVEVSCPVFKCEWRELHASAEVVNEYGVRDPMPSHCPKHGIRVRVDRIVEVVR